MLVQSYVDSLHVKTNSIIIDAEPAGYLDSKERE